MMNDGISLEELLNGHMRQAAIGTQRLETLVNTKFPNLIHRSTIRNWRDGSSRTVQNWEQLVAIANVLQLSLAETNQLLQAAKLATLEALRDRFAETSGEYFDVWQTELAAEAEAAETIEDPPVSSVEPQMPRVERGVWLKTAVLPTTILITLIALILYFTNFYNDPNAVPTPNVVTLVTPTTNAAAIANTTTPAPSPTRLPSPLLVKNEVSFEGEADLNAWEWHEACRRQIRSNFPAHSGASYLAIIKDEALACDAFSTTLDLTPEAGETYRFAIWVYSPTRVERNGRIHLTAQGGREAQIEVPFSVSEKQWDCVEAALPIENSQHNALQIQISLDAPDTLAYHFDDAKFQVGGIPLCPNFPIAVEFEDTALWGYQGVCDEAIRTDEPFSGEAHLSIQRASADCTSIYRDFSASVEAGQTYYASVWIRSPDWLPKQGEFVLWTGTSPINIEGADEKALTVFNIQGAGWHCVDVTLSVQKSGKDTIRSDVYFKTTPDAEYYIDYLTIDTTESALCPKTTSVDMVNNGFEFGADPLYWFPIGECTPTIVNNEIFAYEGQSYLEIGRNNRTCHSIFQDVTMVPESGQSYYFSMWARSATSAEVPIGVVIWSQGAEEKFETRYFLSGAEWQCIETEIILQEEHYEYLRGEIYFQSDGDEQYLLENAEFKIQENRCPQAMLAFHDISATTDTPYYPGESVRVEVVLKNMSEERSGISQLRAWVTNEENGAPINIESVSKRDINALMANETTESVYLDVDIPVDLEPQTYFVVIELLPNKLIPNNSTPRQIVSIPFDLTNCITETMYCDISVSHWAREEIMKWQEVGMSGGCRGGTEYFLNRPFCPNTIVHRGMFSVLLLRLLEGTDFRPETPYQGQYLDISSQDNQPWADWIGVLHEEGIELPSARCPTDEAKPLYCADLPVTRGELATYLAQQLGWDLDAVEADAFVDVSGDDFTARAINYLWEKGLVKENDPSSPTQDGERYFCPDLPVTRASAAVFMQLDILLDE